MSAIFISYRREDTLSATGRLAETFATAFGAGEVFRDLQAIEAGTDFRRSLAEGLRAARVVIVVIGPSWLRPSQVDQRPRLCEVEDYVRLEIETALSYDLPIIPVLVEGAYMPKPADLPESIRALGFRQAHEVSETRWKYDVDRLIDVIARSADLAFHARSSELHTAGASVRTVLRDAVISIAADFLKLFYMPRRFLAMRGADSHGDLIRAFAFLIVLQPIGASLVLLEWPTQSTIPQFLVTPAVVMLLGTLALSLPLYFAWRLVGVRREYRRVLIILLYQSSIFGLMESVVVLISLIGVNLEIPGAVSDLAGNLTIDGLAHFLAALESASSGVSWAIASFVNTLIALAALIWLAVTWGAYRDVLRQSRARSIIALALFAMFCAIPVGFLAWVASLFQI